MIGSNLKLLFFYLFLLVLLSPVYGMVVFIAIMSTDSGEDRAFLPILLLGFLAITAVPLLISFKLFEDISKKHKCSMYGIGIAVIILFIFIPFFIDEAFIKNLLNSVFEVLIRAFPLFIVVVPMAVVGGIAALTMKKSKS